MFMTKSTSAHRGSFFRYRLAALLMIPVFGACLSVCSAAAASVVILIDYDDGVPGNGIHDVAVRDGDFSLSPDPWMVLAGTSDFQDNNASGVGSDRNYAMAISRILGVDTEYTLSGFETFEMSFMWRDAFNWDNNDTLAMILYYTDDDSMDGSTNDVTNGATIFDVLTFDSGGRDATATWETESLLASIADTGATGKNLFVRFESNSQSNEFARLDNVFLQVFVPEPSTVIMALLGGVGLLLWRARHRVGRRGIHNATSPKATRHDGKAVN